MASAGLASAPFHTLPGSSATLGAGYAISGAVIASGSNTFQLGGTGSSNFDLAAVSGGGQFADFTTFDVVGGHWTVSGAGSGWTVEGGTLEVASGGFLSNTAVQSGGMLVVDSGGTADPTQIRNGGVEVVSQGGSDDGARISGGVQDVFGFASGATVSAGAQVVESGGVVSGTIVKGGTEIVDSGGTASDVTISSGATLELVGLSGLPVGVTLVSGAILALGQGAVFSGNVVSSGATLEVISGGVESGGTVLSGGVLEIFSGGIASGVTVEHGGKVLVFSGGSDVGPTVASGGTEIVSSGGLDVRGMVAAGGHILVSRGGTVELLGNVTLASYTLFSGAAFAVGSGYLLSGLIVTSGLTEEVLPGGTSINPVVRNGANVAVEDGALLTLSGAVGNSGTINLSGQSGGSGATLLLAGNVTLSGGGKRAAIAPLLTMPPEYVVVSCTLMAGPPLPTILLWLSILMPPEMIPVSTMPPLCNVAPMTDMPCGPIVPTFVTPPLNVVALISKPVVWPLKTVGYGPLKAMKPPVAQQPQLAEPIAPRGSRFRL